MAIEKPKSLKDFINIAANTDSTSVYHVPDVQSERQLGAFLVENGFVDVPEYLLDCVNHRQIGSNYLQKNPATLTNEGYMEDARNATEIKEIYDGVNLPKLFENNLQLSTQETQQIEQKQAPKGLQMNMGI